MASVTGLGRWKTNRLGSPPKRFVTVDDVAAVVVVVVVALVTVETPLPLPLLPLVLVLLLVLLLLLVGADDGLV